MTGKQSDITNIPNIKIDKGNNHSNEYDSNNSSMIIFQRKMKNITFDMLNREQNYTTKRSQIENRNVETSFKNKKLLFMKSKYTNLKEYPKNNSLNDSYSSVDEIIFDNKNDNKGEEQAILTVDLSIINDQRANCFIYNNGFLYDLSYIRNSESHRYVKKLYDNIIEIKIYFFSTIHEIKTKNNQTILFDLCNDISMNHCKDKYSNVYDSKKCTLYSSSSLSDKFWKFTNGDYFINL